MGKISEPKRLRLWRQKHRKKYLARQRELYKLNREHKLTLRAKKRPVKLLDLSPRAHCKLFYKQCEGCGATFTTWNPNKKACKYNHLLSNKKFRKKRKAVNKYKQPISKFYRKQIELIYENKPPGLQVDHIIPINGDNVSGLHVPWNLQYLTPEANNKKSNKI